MKCIQKCTYFIERSLDFIEENDIRHHRREFILHCSRFCNCFSLLICAACDDPNDVFYQKECTKDVETLCNVLEVVKVDDLHEHLLNMQHGIDYVKFLHSVIPKGIYYEYKVLQGLALLSWGAIYKIWTKESLLEGELVTNCINDDLQRKFTLFCQQEFIRNALVDIPGTLDVNLEIFTQKSIEDELTVDSMSK